MLLISTVNILVVLLYHKSSNAWFHNNVLKRNFLRVWKTSVNLLKPWRNISLPNTTLKIARELNWSREIQEVNENTAKHVSKNKKKLKLNVLYEWIIIISAYKSLTTMRFFWKNQRALVLLKISWSEKYHQF